MDYSKIKYQHINKIGTTDVEGLLDGACYIYPKIDGTNCPIWFNEETNEIMVGSRTRILSEDADNAGAYKTIHNDERLQRFFKDYPNYILYTEFLIPHTIKTYEGTAWRNFYVFDVVDRDKTEHLPHYLTYEEYQPLMEQYELLYIPLLKKIDNPTVEELQELTQINTYLIQENGGIGEGIVIKRYDFISKYGRREWGKIVVSEFGHKKHTPKIVPEDAIEKQIAAKYLTIEFIEKEYSKIYNEMNGWSSKYIGRLLSTIWYEFIKDYMCDILKKYRNPTIDFKILQSSINEIIKQTKTELF
jgi:hypothetical protein